MLIISTPQNEQEIQKKGTKWNDWFDQCLSAISANISLKKYKSCINFLIILMAKYRGASFFNSLRKKYRDI